MAEQNKVFSTTQMLDIMGYLKDKINSLEIIKIPTLKPLSQCTSQDVVDIADAYYQGFYSLNNIKEVWSVGDGFDINLGAIGAYSDTGSITETHAAQTVEMTIIDFDHDPLKVAINGKNNALLTLQTKSCLSETGYWDKRNPGIQGWSSTKRRNWCNDDVYNAIPQIVREKIKLVSRNNFDSSHQIEIVDDKVFILTQYEILATGSADGTQYPYFTTTENRKKAAIWWTSTDNYNSGGNGNYVILTDGRSQDYAKASTPCGLAFAFCI